MTFYDRMSNFTIETEIGDIFVFEFRDLSVKREDQTGITKFQNDVNYVQKIYHGAERHSYELYLSGPDYDIAATNFWEATKDRSPLTLKHPLIDKAVNCQIMSIERNDNLASAAGEAVFVVDILESSILDKAPEDTTRQAYIMQQYELLQQANSKYYHFAVPSTPSALEKAKKAMKTATAAVNRSLMAYDLATDVLADLKSVERTCSGLAETLETNAELFSQAFQGFIELAIEAGESFVKISMIDQIIDLFDVFNQDIDDSSKLMLSISMTGGLIMASTQTTALDYQSKLAVYEQSEKIFAYYQQVIDLADTLEIDSDLIIRLNDLMNLTAAKLEQISFQAKQERTIELKHDSEIYTLVYRIIPCENMAKLDQEVETFIKANKLGGKELFELRAGRRLKYYL